MSAKILIGTFEEVQADREKIKEIAAVFFRAAGLLVVDNEVVTQNGETKKPDMDAPRIGEWDEIKEYKGKYWIFSPAIDPNFINYRQYARGYTWKCAEVIKDWEEESEVNEAEQFTGKPE